MKNRRRGIDSQIHRLGLPDLRTPSEVLAFLLFWPCMGVIGWMAIDPYGFRDALLRLLGVTP